MDLKLIGNLLQLIGSATLLYSYIPQIIQLVKTKKSEDLNTTFWGVLTLGLACITGNMAISGVPTLILFTQGLNAVLAGVTLYLVIKYKKRG